MKVDFLRFKASDGVELRGWLSNENSDIAVIHIHGMSGNGYENHFLDNLREMLSKNSISFFTIDTRGSGIMNSFWKGTRGSAWGEGAKLGGSCYEIFEESELDVQGAIDFLKTQGKKRFILTGHSLGGSKVVNFLAKNDHREVTATVLLAPTDMVGWARTDPNHQTYLKKAKELIKEGKGEKLVSAGCWLDETPLSAQTYATVCEASRAVDIYGGSEAPLGKVAAPTLILYGDIDIGITRIDGTIDHWLKRVNKIKNKNTEISIVGGAPHSFRGFEKELANVVEKFLSRYSA